MRLRQEVQALPRSLRLDHDDSGSNRSRIMNVIDL
nr:hypothetical protein [Nitrobacter sp. 62-13]